MDTKHYKTYVQIGLNILYYRKQQGLTQENLAEIIDITQQHMQRIETAHSIPSLPTLLNIADALGVPVEKLFERR
ncbi:helix-turn-helix transcriptional regulator [Pseudoflavonifractor phocaeensis]|uniref:helix-turn-helix transcriptional regulator n=1 Tax=Pseudoflavonifractor phocaeensis TaxID=1870988 RepID=UPI00195BB2C8|nr:helix-turn-helix transcriptional regulator [Pseudoflavonifractor phocaeensis]MBM6871065.1 helix-turn-helix transcriptional regulator [Pseudoflavonifractor phocaeensis]MBM6937214.1 helix-turn-helix transcriptional regulator [Pseudoflavonifractor phocaeensis]